MVYRHFVIEKVLETLQGSGYWLQFVFYQDSHEVLGAQSRVPPELGVLVKPEGEVAELENQTLNMTENCNFLFHGLSDKKIIKPSLFILGFFAS